MHPLAERIAKQDIRALARAITFVESDHEEKLDLLQSIHPMTGRAHYIGITGSPGAGKSSLVNRLIDFLRKQDLLVGVVAVDPTSPFSGGAILGDRVRMAHHFTDPGVFIRSMGTRGSLGGLARTTKEAVRLMDAFGFDVILIETVGVGQSELDIMKIADTTAVVVNPGSGDVVQVFKAGIMEIADLFVINKADLPGVGRLNGQINSLLDLIKHHNHWRPPVIRVSATKNQGIPELWEVIIDHRNDMRTTGDRELKRQEHFKSEVLEIVHYELMNHLKDQLEHNVNWSKANALASDPYTAAKKVIHQWLPSMEKGTKQGDK